MSCDGRHRKDSIQAHLTPDRTQCLEQIFSFVGSYLGLSRPGCVPGEGIVEGYTRISAGDP